MFTRKIIRLAFAGTVLSGVGVVTSAQAAISAAGGAALKSSEAACFTRNTDGLPSNRVTGQVTNTCPGSPTWCVADYITSSGSKNVAVNAFIQGSVALTCSATATDKAGRVVDSVTKVLKTFGSNQDLAVGSVSVPSYGALMVCCDVPPSGRLNTVNY